MAASIASRAQRLRARAVWAFLLAGVCLGATVIGLAQYLHSGVVSIRPGHDPVTGEAARELLATLGLVGVALAGCGAALRSRATHRSR